MPSWSLLCEFCGSTYSVKERRRLAVSRFCSRLCRARGISTPEVNAKRANRGVEHPRYVPVGTRRKWRGVPGIMVKTEHGWEREHRVVAGLGGKFRHPCWNVVHHLNGDPEDNRPENLELMTQSEHVQLHNPQRERDALGRFTS